MKLEAKLKWNFINNGVMVLLCRNPLCGPSCHAKLLSLSGEWTQEVEFSVATTEEWCCLLPLFLVCFHRGPQWHFLSFFNIKSPEQPAVEQVTWSD